jgi:hypothetical protein
MKLSDLKGTITVSKYEAHKQADFLTAGIMKDKKLSRGENIHQVYNRCLKGAICELGIADKIGGTLNNQVFNHKDRGTYAYDIVSSGGYKIEVKRQRTNWLTLRPDVKNRLTKNIAEGHIDYIITCDYEDNPSSYYTVIPKLLIMSDSFAKFTTRSKFNDNYVFQHYNAAKVAGCFDLSTPAVKAAA